LHPNDLIVEMALSVLKGRFDYLEELLTTLDLTIESDDAKMRRWRVNFEDPNDPELMQLRQAAISMARSERLITDRVAYLCELVSDKSVLDIGVVEHTRDASLSSGWLHGHLTRHAKSCLGTDVLETEVKHLNAQGYNVIVADITEAPLTQKFDIIVGGEVLEHLDLPGMFMKNCAAMLDPGGLLAITVPNPWYINAMFKSCFKRYTFVDSADHVAWYDASTLFELGQRNGFRLERFIGITVTNPKRLRARLFFNARPFLTRAGLAPLLFAKSIIYEFVRV
jgi:2-polyprenyl-3-methyl-5-hydroxy-6-metoxy-1,4-benzoquinol methylase